MIDFDLSRRPVRQSDWTALAAAVLASTDPVESDWLEMKSELNWSNPHGLGTLSKAILGMSNRDPQRAAEYLGGIGIVMVVPSTRVDFPVQVIDNAYLEQKIETYVGAGDGPRWMAHWVKVNQQSVLVLEVEAPRNGDPGFTLRQKFDDYRASQTFVRIGTKTVIADQSEMQRLARRFLATDSKESLAVDVGYTLEEPLCRIFMDEADLEDFLLREEIRLITSLESPEKAEPYPGLSSSTQSLIQSISSIVNNLTERHEESRTPEEFRAEVAAYIAGARAVIGSALQRVACNVVPIPTFWLSNLSDNNFKDVQVTIRVEGMAAADDATNEKDLRFRSFLPKRPRRFGPYTTQNSLGLLAQQMGNLPYIPSTVTPLLSYGRREIRNGGSFEVDFDVLSLRPRTQQVVLEAGLAILIPCGRTDPVIVKWTATASNVNAVAEGEFELPFDGEPIDLLNEAVS